MNKIHEPVLLEEVVKNLHIKKFDKIIDATLGVGGYTKAFLNADALVLGIDTDEKMLEIAKKNIQYHENAKLVHGNFKDIGKIARENGFDKVDGIVFDLGVSNVHFSDEKRGFSFKNNEADLDMRLDTESQSVKAADLLNLLRKDQLENIFGKSLTLKIIDFRKTRKFRNVGDFMNLFPDKKPGMKIHPATVPFMMLRIAVNSELENLKEALPQAWELLKLGGKLEVVSFHSLEDEIVKKFMKASDFIKPSAEEIARNSKSRSAILRIVTKYER